MSDTTSTRSNAGSTSDSNGASENGTPPPRRSFAERYGVDGAATPLTKANLDQNNSYFANWVREQKAQETVDGIAAAARSLGFELPEKTKLQLLEEKSGVSPIEYFKKSKGHRAGGLVDDAFWNTFVLNDPLAAPSGAELDVICRQTAAAAAGAAA